MAVRRPRRPGPEPDDIIVTGDNEQVKKKNVMSFFKRVKTFFADERVQIVCGILLLALALYLTIALVSFFFSGRADFSILEQTGYTRRQLRTEVQNLGGLEGAQIIKWLTDGTFGLASVSILVMLVLYGLELVRAIKIKNIKTLFCTAFWLCWGSVALSFVQISLSIGSFFRWGGKHGAAVADWIISYIDFAGLLILLIVSLLIFFICVDRNTIPNMKRFGEWFLSLFKKKQPVSLVDTVDLDIDTDEDNDSERDDDKDEDEIRIEEGDNGQEGDNTITFTLDENNDIVDVKGGEDGGFDIKVGGDEESGRENEKAEDASDEQDKQKEQEDANMEMDINTGEETELSEDDPDYLLKKYGPYDPHLDLAKFQAPPLSLLKVYDNETTPVVDYEEQNSNKDRIVQAFRNFGIEIKSISATVGPTVTLYEIIPKEGVKISRITSLENDIMMSLAAKGIRMIAPMPGKGTVGIEVPNKKPQIVSMHAAIASKRFIEEKKMRLPVVMGKTITNEIFMFDLAKTPHLLVAGATGQGKSVGLNAIITSLLYKKHPSELKFVLVDPKMVEFSLYEPLEKFYMAAMPDYDNIIITESNKVINTLNSLVIEMENRYLLLKDARCKNLEEYNEKFVNRRLNPAKEVLDINGKPQNHRFLPYLVIIIDEFGDFIMVAGKEVERPIARIAQKARAVGMHMILATQRPSVNIITGTIKANIPTRIAFRTQSVVDSRTVLDAKGAEGLVGKGDMLYSGGTETQRIQCAFVDTPEVEAIVKFISEQKGYPEPYELPEYVGEQGEGGEPKPGEVDLKKLDPMFTDVARYVVANQQGSTSVLQRKFQIGYNRAGKLTDQLEAAGIVGPNNGPKGRAVLIQDETTLEQILKSLG